MEAINLQNKNSPLLLPKCQSLFFHCPSVREATTPSLYESGVGINRALDSRKLFSQTSRFKIIADIRAKWGNFLLLFTKLAWMSMSMSFTISISVLHHNHRQLCCLYVILSWGEASIEVGAKYSGKVIRYKYQKKTMMTSVSNSLSTWPHNKSCNCFMCTEHGGWWHAVKPSRLKVWRREEGGIAIGNSGERVKSCRKQERTEAAVGNKHIN